MDFFAAQDLRRRETKKLIALYALCIALMILGIYAALEFAWQYFDAKYPVSHSSSSPSVATPTLESFTFHPQLLVGVTAANLLVIGCACFSKVRELKSGGHHIAAQLGGVRIPPSTTDLKLKRLLNIVEEMALASGTSVPPVYLLHDEQGINAFAAGYSPGDAVIGVNRGTVDHLTRDELQGVIAHEYSHVLNGDMRLNIRLIGWLFGIQAVAMIGYFVLRSVSMTGTHRNRRSNSKEGGGLMIAVLICGAALVVFGFLGRFFARMIQASISRKREFLADASAVQFTRNPDGIAGALKLIAATSAGSAIASGEADEVSHMFFANCFQSGVTKLFATHPPLPVRINKLQPDFDGDLNKWIEARKQKSQQKAAKKDTSSAAKMASSVLPLGRLFPQAIVDRFPIDPIVLLAAIGSPQDKDMQRTRALLKQVPVEILDSVRDPFSARCLAFAMLISDDPNDREQQLQLLGEIENPATLKATDALLDPVSNLHLIFRLPVMELLQASLADLSPPQYLQFRNTVQRLVHADQRTSLFEFVIRHHLLLHLDRRFTQRNRPKVKYTRASELQREIELMLSAFASASVMGSVLDSQPEPDKAVILQAYHLAMEVVGFGSVVDSHAELRLWEVEQLEGCMQKLHHASPKLKKQFLHAAAVLITFDHEITVAEAEFFRAVAESLDCPVPLLAAGRTTAANAPTQPTGEAEAS